MKPCLDAIGFDPAVQVRAPINAADSRHRRGTRGSRHAPRDVVEVALDDLGRHRRSLHRAHCVRQLNIPRDERDRGQLRDVSTATKNRPHHGFGLALMMTWLSLTTTEKSTPFALYCSMIFGACELIVLSSFP